MNRDHEAVAAEMARLVPDSTQAIRIASQAGIRSRALRPTAHPHETWRAVVELATGMDRMPQLLDRVGFHLHDSTSHGRLFDPSPEDPLAEPSWADVTPNEVEQHERQLGDRSTLLPVTFLRAGLAAASSVCKISYDVRDHNGRSRTVTGTGFLISDDQLLTCYHVLPTPAVAASAVAEFNFERDVSGAQTQSDRVELAPHLGFATSGSAKYDWTIVTTRRPVGDTYGFHRLMRIDLSDVLYVNIVGHPHGETKQLSLYDNVVQEVTADRVLYTTETARGSSGSPVFDSQWRVVALHNGWHSEFSAGKMRRVVRNAGVNINRIVERAR